MFPFKVKFRLNSADAIEAKRYLIIETNIKEKKRFPHLGIRCVEQQNTQCSFLRRCIKMNGLSIDDKEV